MASEPDVPLSPEPEPEVLPPLRPTPDEPATDPVPKEPPTRILPEAPAPS